MVQACLTLSFCCARIFIWDRHLTKPTSLRACSLSYLFRRCSDPDPLLLITENNDTTFVRGSASWLVESSKLNIECEPQTGTSWPLTSQRKGVKEEIAHMYMQPITQQPPFFALVMLLGLLVPPPSKTQPRSPRTLSPTHNLLCPTPSASSSSPKVLPPRVTV